MSENRYVLRSSMSEWARELTCTERHYSYECKASVQDRPYASRPSRSQQLRNPKLVPKLTNDTPDPLEKKAGVADEELAKKEAERARKRGLDERDDEMVESRSKRRRSVSSESVSTISTGASSRSPSPRHATRGRSPPPRRQLSPEARAEGGRPDPRRSYSRSDSRSYSNSRSRSPPPARRSRSSSPDDRSLARGSGQASYQDDRSPQRAGSQRQRVESRRHSPARADRDSREYRQQPSPRSARSGPGGRDELKPREARSGQGRERRDDAGGHGRSRDTGYQEERQQRERSLSPFSKRLALTQALNTERR